MPVMEITIHVTFLPRDDSGTRPGVYRDALGFEVPTASCRRDTLDHGRTHRSVGTSLLHPAGHRPGITDKDRGTIAEMMIRDPAGDRKGSETYEDDDM